MIRFSSSKGHIDCNQISKRNFFGRRSSFHYCDSSPVPTSPGSRTVSSGIQPTKIKKFLFIYSKLSYVVLYGIWGKGNAKYCIIVTLLTYYIRPSVTRLLSYSIPKLRRTKLIFFLPLDTESDNLALHNAILCPEQLFSSSVHFGRLVHHARA
jgi:hypothetical protein